MIIEISQVLYSAVSFIADSGLGRGWYIVLYILLFTGVVDLSEIVALGSPGPGIASYVSHVSLVCMLSCVSLSIIGVSTEVRFAALGFGMSYHRSSNGLHRLSSWKASWFSHLRALCSKFNVLCRSQSFC